MTKTVHNSVTDEMIEVRVTNGDIALLSVYFSDKDEDAEKYGFTDVFDRIHRLANAEENYLIRHEWNLPENYPTDVLLRMTKSDLVSLSRYFNDNVDDIEGCGIDAVVTSIHHLANPIEISMQENEAQ